MATTDEHGCDGCGRELTAVELYPVEMPGGQTAVCCPECRRHAKAAAKKQADIVATRECDGCGDVRANDDLADTRLPDGVTVSLCPSCEAEAPSADEDADTTVDADSEPDTDAVRNRCDQCREWVAEELWSVVTVDDRTEEFCQNCRERAEREGIVTKVRLKRDEAYDILDVPEDAAKDTIHTAYIEQVKRAHPDRDTGSRYAFVRVQKAYERLSD
jgi:hypothetical protein